jgi:hypothetical protein
MQAALMHRFDWKIGKLNGLIKPRVFCITVNMSQTKGIFEKMSSATEQKFKILSKITF